MGRMVRFTVVLAALRAAALFGEDAPVSLTVRAEPDRVAEAGEFTVELALRSGGEVPVVFDAPVLSEVRNARVVAVTVEDRGGADGRLRRYVYALRAGRRGEAVFGTVAVRYRLGDREDFLVSPVVTVEVTRRRGGAPFLVFVAVLLAGAGAVAAVALGRPRRKAV